MSGESPGAPDAGVRHDGEQQFPSFSDYSDEQIPRALRPRLWPSNDEFYPESPSAHSHFTQTFLQSILTSIESKDQAVATAWLETLLDVFDLLPSTVLHNEILNLTLKKAQLTSQVDARLAAARLLGKLATRFDPVLIQTELLPLAQNLSQDVSPAVRACVARQIQPVAKGLGVEATKAHLLPGLVELANDEDQEVKLAALETVVVLTSFLDTETVKSTILPLILKICERALRVQDDSLNFLAQHFGKICHSFAGCVRGEEKVPLISYYQQMSRLGLNAYRPPDEGKSGSTPMPDIVPVFANQTRHLDCRLHCAFNLPAMALFARVDDMFDSQLQDTLAVLASDPHRAVRYTVACGIHEICLLVGSSNQVVWAHFVQLVRDGSIDVIQALIGNLPASIQGITEGLLDSAGENGQEDEKVTANVTDLTNALIQCEDTITSKVQSGSSWRLHSSFLRAISFLPQYLPHQRVYPAFLSLLFERMHNARPVPCRESAAYALLVFLRHSRKREDRQEILDKLSEEFCRGKSYHKRMLYLKTCEMAVSVFSKSYFKNYFFRNALGLTGDKVVNVRIRACTFLPLLKSVLELPRDRQMVSEFDDVVNKIAGSEKDRDVQEAVQKSVSVMEDVPVRVADEDSRTFDSDTEAEDKQKEAAEKAAHSSDSGLGTGSDVTRDGRSPDAVSNAGSAVSGSGSDGRGVSTPINLTVGDSPTSTQPSQPLASSSSLPVATWSSRIRDSRQEAPPSDVTNNPFRQQQQKSRSRTPLMSYEASQSSMARHPSPNATNQPENYPSGTGGGKVKPGGTSMSTTKPPPAPPPPPGGPRPPTRRMLPVPRPEFDHQNQGRPRRRPNFAIAVASARLASAASSSSSLTFPLARKTSSSSSSSSISWEQAAAAAAVLAKQRMRRSRSSETGAYGGGHVGHRRVSLEEYERHRSPFGIVDPFGREREEQFALRDRSLPYFTPAEGDRLWMQEQLLQASALSLYEAEARESRQDTWKQPHPQDPLNIRLAMSSSNLIPHPRHHHGVYNRQQERHLRQRSLDGRFFSPMDPSYEELHYLALQREARSEFVASQASAAANNRLHRFRRMMTNSPPDEFPFLPRSLPWDLNLSALHGSGGGNVGREYDVRGAVGGGFGEYSASPSARPSFISRLENLDPSTDEFLVDAGVRMSPAAWKPLKAPPNVLPFGGYPDRMTKSEPALKVSSSRNETALRRRQGFGMYFWDGPPSASPPSSAPPSLPSSKISVVASRQSQQQQQQQQQQLQMKKQQQEASRGVGQLKKVQSVEDKVVAGGGKGPQGHLSRMSTMPELVVARRGGGGGGGLRTSIVGGSAMVPRRKSTGAVPKPSKLRPPSSRVSFSGVPGTSPNTSSAESSPISSRSSSPGGADLLGASSNAFSRGQPQRSSVGSFRGASMASSSSVMARLARNKATSANSSPTMQRAAGKMSTPIDPSMKRRPMAQPSSSSGNFTPPGSSRLPQPRLGAQKDRMNK